MKKVICNYNHLQDIIDASANKQVVLVGGCFDILHFGHIVFLQKAKLEGDFLVVALESDQFIKEIKRRQSIHNQEQRAQILAALEFVDGVVLLPYFTKTEEYMELVTKVKPAVIAVTSGDTQLKNKQLQAAAVGATVKITTPLLSEFSTTSISTKI